MSREEQETVCIVRTIDGTDLLFVQDSESWVTGKEVHLDDEDAEDVSKPKRIRHRRGALKQPQPENIAGDHATNEPAKHKSSVPSTRDLANKALSTTSSDVFLTGAEGTTSEKGKGKQKELVLKSPHKRSLYIIHHCLPSVSAGQRLLVPDVDENPQINSSMSLQDIEDVLYEAVFLLDSHKAYQKEDAFQLLKTLFQSGTLAFRAWTGHFTKIANELDQEPSASANDPRDNLENTPTSAHKILVDLHHGMCDGEKHIGDAYAMLDALLNAGSDVYALRKAHFNVINEAASKSVSEPPDILLQFPDHLEYKRTLTPPPITFNEHPSTQLCCLYPKIDLSKHLPAHRHAQPKQARKVSSNAPATAAEPLVPDHHTISQPSKLRPLAPLLSRAISQPTQV
ncbi:hypothetical protein VNI00_017322 [Paramarasmius palmivorus]|uniref:Uncharacterized protein n=1 Tax=Paramarasmius palmivorus TaxID=297713 RepID=A0AAW0B7B6_9AGAR